jgi:REP element-mobilizing transposase RayT
MTHHVVVRGVARAPLFLDDDDRENLLGRFERILPESGARCLAWALIPNHFHLLLTVGSTPLSRVMSRIETGYARRFNERHGRVGHLCQNRFLSRPVHHDADVMGLVRYVHANPLRHGLVHDLATLEAFPWCGHGALIGSASARPFHAVDTTLLLFGTTRAGARRRLAAWMARALEEPAETGPTTAERSDRDERERPASASESSRSPVDVERIVAVVAERLGGRLQGPSKVRAAVQARAVVAHLANEQLGASTRLIARALRVSERAAGRSVELGARIARSHDALLRELRARIEESPNRQERPRQ